MNKRLILMLVVTLTVALALNCMALAQADKDQAGAYAVQVEAASGGSYHLDSGGWRVEGVAGGSGYHLEAVSAPAGNGIPCCCTWLTCIQRSQP
jgi:hypothetical protein